MKSRFRSDTQGSALVEAALVLPVLLLLLFGVIDFTLFVSQSSSANKAVHLGVRKAIVSDPVAAGPGLTPAESSTYWNGLPLGTKCSIDASNVSPCPVFAVECSAGSGCNCSGARCGFVLIQANMAPILSAMRAALPQIRPDQIQVRYATNYLGYVGRPVPVPADVTVSITGMAYEPIFLNNLLGPSLPIRASATLPGESMASRLIGPLVRE